VKSFSVLISYEGVSQEMKYSAFTVLLPDKNLEEVFELLRELGYDGVELRVKEDYHLAPHTILSRVKELEDLKTRYRLEIPVLASYLPITDLKTLMPLFEAADILGTGGVRVSLGPPLDARRSYWEAKDHALGQLNAFIQSIQPFKVKALFEIHFKTLIASPSMAYLLLKEFDPMKVGVIHDAGNMIIEGREDWKTGVEILGGYLGHVHVKNISWQKADKWNWRWDELATGMVDWKEVLTALFSVAYEDYLSNENLKDVVLPGATGFIGEELSKGSSKPFSSIRKKLTQDLKYLKALEQNILDNQEMIGTK
jgi:sugar phosphate isomerase/epimerase